MSSVVCDKHKLIFLHIPKTGGRSVVEILLNNQGHHLRDDNNDLTPLLLSNLKHNSILTKQKLKNYHVFTVVRNPYDRFVSSYNWHFKTKVKNGQDYGDCYYKNYLTFKEALTKENSYKHEIPGFYWHTNITMTKHLNNLNYIDTIIKFENYENELTEFLKIKNLKFNQIPHKHISNKNKVDYWDKRNEEIFYKKFKKDFNNFNYKRKKL